MSKLLDKLSQVSRGSVQPLGFRAATATSKSPQVVLIVCLAQGDAQAAAAAKEGADAVLVKGAQSRGKLGASLGQVPWGTSLGEATEEELAQLKGKGCDFLVFDAAKAPLTLLREEDMGKIVEIDSSLADGLVRAIEQLPIDAVLIGGEPSLSVHRLMVCQHLANLVRKPLVALAPLDMSKEDLEGLCEAGMAGVVVNVEGDAKEVLLRLRQTIDALPPSRKGRREKADALLPYFAEVETAQVEEEEEE